MRQQLVRGCSDSAGVFMSAGSRASRQMGMIDRLDECEVGHF